MLPGVNCVNQIAIIGSGIAGLGVAHYLSIHAPEAKVTLFEADEKIGGHTATVQVTVPGELPVSFDTGFMVYNEVTYPNLTKLFTDLGVQTQPTSMSFSVQNRKAGIEYSGTSLNHLFAQRKNLLRPSFVRLLWQINRFNADAIKMLEEALENPTYAQITLQDYVRERDYGQNFMQQYLIPMSAAVWSTEYTKMLEFPAQTLLRFFYNHGFLGLHTQHPWRTVSGGSQNYVDKILARFLGTVLKSDPVTEVSRVTSAHQVQVRSRSGERVFDQVVIAAHADQALRLLSHPTEMERNLLSSFNYQNNSTLIHTDESVMPKKKLAWSSWNYLMLDQTGTQASTHYWMNRLQALGGDTEYFVSLNAEELVDPKKILLRLNYTHPLFSGAAIRAQADLPKLNQQEGGIYFSGSYFKYGFHEDAYTSALNAAQVLLGRAS